MEGGRGRWRRRREVHIYNYIHRGREMGGEGEEGGIYNYIYI